MRSLETPACWRAVLSVSLLIIAPCALADTAVCVEWDDPYWTWSPCELGPEACHCDCAVTEPDVDWSDVVPETPCGAFGETVGTPPTPTQTTTETPECLFLSARCTKWESGGGYGTSWGSRSDGNDDTDSPAEPDKGACGCATNAIPHLLWVVVAFGLLARRDRES